MRAHIYAFLCAGLGVLAFKLLQLPLPWLLGPIFACLIAALLGVPMRGVKVINEAMRSILGIAVGATFSLALLVSMGSMWPTLLLIPVMTICIGLVGVFYFQRLWGFDFATSYYSAMPGGLQDMLIFGEEAGGNVRTLALIHATRVLVIVVTLPFLLTWVWDADLSNPPGAPAASIALSQLGWMVFCGLVGWQLAKRMGMFGASILGPLLLAALLSLTGILHHRPPIRSHLGSTIFHRNERWVQIRRRDHGGNSKGCDRGAGVLHPAVAAGGDLRRRNSLGGAGARVGNRSRLRTWRTSGIDRARPNCWSGYGLCRGPSCLANIYRYSGCTALCAPVQPEN